MAQNLEVDRFKIPVLRDDGAARHLTGIDPPAVAPAATAGWLQTLAAGLPRQI